MPTYQYACKDCDYRFEEVQAFSDPSLTECPHCQGHLRKVYGSVGVVFKGSGFYRTDSRSGSNQSSLSPQHSSDSSDSSTSAAESKNGSANGSSGDTSGAAAGPKSGAAGSGSSAKSSGSSAKTPAAAAS